MISLALTLILSLVSFFSSAFVVLRALLPLVPDNHIHPTKRTRTRKRSLSQSEKAHLWLAFLNILSIIILVWDVLDQHISRPTNFDVVEDAASTSRLQVVFTLTPTCLFALTAVTLFQACKAKVPSFGPFHMLVWIPVLVLTAVSAAIAGVMASRKIRSFEIGTASYVCSLAVLNTAVMAYLVVTIKVIRRKLAVFHEADESWQDILADIRSFHSFPSGPVEALKEGSSWITSDSESCRDQVSSFSFGSGESDPGTNEQVTSVRPHPDGSWLTEPSVPPSAMTEWSFPVDCASSVTPSATLNVHATLRDFPTRTRPATPLSSGPCHSYPLRTSTIADRLDVEKGPCSSRRTIQNSLDISWKRIIGWLAFTWIPSVLALTSLLMGVPGSTASALFIVAATIPGSILALNVIFSPFPMPCSLSGDLSSLPKPSRIESRHTLSGSITAVEGRRSVDIWLSKGDAVDGKSRLSRATSLLSPLPKLSLLPVKSISSEKTIRKPAHQPRQYDSAAMSTFVAIETRYANEMGLMPTRSEETSDVEGTSTSYQLSEDQRLSATTSLSTASLPVASSRPISRRSSTSSRSSRGNRLYRSAFATSLETIPDVSMSASPGRNYSESTSDQVGAMHSNVKRPPFLDDVHSPLCSSHVQQDLHVPEALRERDSRVVQADELATAVLSPIIPGLETGPTGFDQTPSMDTSQGATSQFIELTPTVRRVNTDPTDQMRANPQYPSKAPVELMCISPKDRATRTLDHISDPRHAMPTFEQDVFYPRTSVNEVFAPRETYESRIPGRVQPRRSSTSSHSTDDEPNQLHPLHRPSRIPVPVRLRETDVIHTSDRMLSIRDAKEDSCISEFQTIGVPPPLKVAKSTADKRRVVSRSGKL